MHCNHFRFSISVHSGMYSVIARPTHIVKITNKDAYFTFAASIVEVVNYSQAWCDKIVPLLQEWQKS